MVPLLWWRRRRASRPAEVGAGFVATEAPALQATIRSAFELGEGGGPLTVELGFASGAAGRVVVVWRNRNVGFVPPDHLDDMRRQLGAAGSAPLVAPGVVYHDGTWLRVWVGPVPRGPLPAPPAGYDLLPAPPTTIFGFTLGHPGAEPLDGPGASPRG